jgi:hypothetical protein
MNTDMQTVGLEPASNPTIRTPAEKLEGVAFTFCKAATLIAVAGRYALPITALAASGFYVAAFLKGKQDTRCILRFPLLIAGFWVFIAALWLLGALNPSKALYIPPWWR